MVLIKLRHTDEIKVAQIKEANSLIKIHKAYLLKPSIYVKVLNAKGISEMEYPLAIKAKNTTIIEWLSEKEINKLQKEIKKNNNIKQN